MTKRQSASTAWKDYVTYELLIVDEISAGRSGKRLEALQKKRLADLRAVRETGDIRAIVRYEIACLKSELTKFASDKDHRISLQRGIEQLTIVDSMIDHVRDHQNYRYYDQKLVQLQESRKAELPDDEARKCFRKHISRLRNTGKTRMGDGERSILEERRKNINRAEELYMGLQREALGLDKAAEKGQGMGLEPQL